MDVKEAGKKGGSRTAEKVRNGELPADHYQRIGAMSNSKHGGDKTKEKYGNEHYAEIGKLGGQKVKELIARGKLLDTTDGK